MSDIRDLLERVANRVEPRQDAFEQLTRARRRRDAPQRAVAGSVALLVAAAGVGAGLLAVRRLGDGEPGRRPRPAAPVDHAIRVELPRGWTGEVTHPVGSLGPALRAANFPLPSAEQPFVEVAATIPDGGVAVLLQEVVGACPCRGFQDVMLPLVVESADLQEHPTAGRMTTWRTMRVSDRYFVFGMEFGSQPVPDALLDEVNGVLSTLTIEPLSSPTPSRMAEPVRPAPFFEPAPGWHIASASSSSDSADISLSWASTQPFAGEDLIASARAGTLVFPPLATLQTLPPEGTLIVASDLESADPRPLELPVSLADAEIDGVWEGQPAPNIPLYRIAADVDGLCGDASGSGRCLDVRVYFGTQTPSSDVLAEADRQLGRLRIP